jgi:hypothetical protein
MRLVPEGISARHPAFDVTPAAFVTAIVTEAGIVRPPFGSGIARLLGLDAEPAPQETGSFGTDDDDETEVESADTAAVLAAEGSDGEEESSRDFGAGSDDEEELFP